MIPSTQFVNKRIEITAQSLNVSILSFPSKTKLNNKASFLLHEHLYLFRISQYSPYCTYVDKAKNENIKKNRREKKADLEYFCLTLLI